MTANGVLQPQLRGQRKSEKETESEAHSASYGESTLCVSAAYNRPVHAVLRRYPIRLFAAASLLLAGVCMIVVRSRAFAASPDVAAWGVTFDLAISMPLLYWLLVVRTGKAAAVTVAPVFVAGTMLAAAVVPDAQQQFVRQLGAWMVPVAEVLLVGALVRRVAAARKERSASTDPYERIHFAARTLAGEGRVAEIIASEVAMFYYAIFGWKLRAADDERAALTFHERNGWGSILACIFVLIAAEGLGMHLLLSRWSNAAAWTWTALDLWAVLWFLGDYHALRLRRTLVDESGLELRFGLRWSATVSRDQIASIEEIRDESEWKRRDVLKVAILDAPRILVTFREPVVLRGLAGLRKTVNAVALLPDQEDALSVLRRAFSADGRSSERP